MAGLGGFGNAMNMATGIAQNVRSTVNKFKGIISSETDNSSIRDRYTNGFYGDTTQFIPKMFSRLFDEPTYLTFRIEFDFSLDKVENMSSLSGKYGAWSSLDYMPEPLLSIYECEKLPSDNPEYNKPEDNNSNIAAISDGEDEIYYGVYNQGKSTELKETTVSGSRKKIKNAKQSFYSTYRYLCDAVGDFKRANMLEQFINSLKDIQDNYPYYFTGIEGLNSLSMVRPERGIRLDDENNIITISCLEGLDLKITQLMQLYRKVAWDDVYQRWVLPDMMRYFNVKIYVSEIRLFHTMSKSSSAQNEGRLYDLNNTDTLNATSYDRLPSYNKGLFEIANNIANTAMGMSSAIFGPSSGIAKVTSAMNMTTDTLSAISGAIKGDMKLCDNAINDVMPTIVYDCKMCEFDISDTLSHISSLTSSKEGLESPKPVIKIKVGKVKEEMYFPLQKGLAINETNKKYSLKDSKELEQNFIKDINLEISGTRYDDFIPTFNDTMPTNKQYRINKNFGTIDKNDEAYNPFSADRKTSITALAGGIAGFVGTSHDSEAIEGDYVDEVKNIYAIGDKIHSSEAISNGESRQRVDPNEVYNPANRNSKTRGGGLIDPDVGMYRSSAVVSGENKRNNVESEEIQPSEAEENGKRLRFNPEPIHKSEVVTAGDNIRSNRNIENLHESTATSQEQEIQKLIEEEGPENIFSAATSIQKMVKYVEEGDVIKSVATDDETSRRLMKNIVLENAIQSLSMATDKSSEAVRKLSNMINREYLKLHKSSAIDISPEKKHSIIQTFNYLNGV